MLEVFEKLIKEIEKIKEGKPTLLGLVKDCKCSKEEWEDYKKCQLQEKEEVDKYFKEKEKEEQKPKLTDKEREYLSVVINPFRNKVNFIKKRGGITLTMSDKEFIVVDLGIEDISFPIFEKGEYYQGLEAEREYSLEELGL